MHTALIALRFFLCVKVTLSTPHGTLETVDLAEREICLISTNESQRRLAMSKYTAAVEKARVREGKQVSSTSSLAIVPMSANSAGSGNGKARSARRPHTSAGPWDSAREVARGAARRAAQGCRDVRPRSRAQHGHTSSEAGASEAEHVRAREDEPEQIEARSHWRTVVETPKDRPSPRSVPSLNSFFASPPPASASSSEKSGVSAAADSVQAWEEELERIAVQSRRRSVGMLGFRSERRTRPRIDDY